MSSLVHFLSPCRLRRIVRAVAGPSAVAISLSAGSLSAQPQVRSGEIVQPLPDQRVTRLNEALQRLASEPRSVDALIEAGTASLDVGDIEAAIAFFGRADDVSPDNPRVKLGFARAYVVSRRPVEALRLFAEAEREGAPVARYAAERGLAFDLVGDNVSAQAQYLLAIGKGGGDAIRRRLAISQAISGDRDRFEATLLSMLQQGDAAAFRTRALGLAILGRTGDAIEIVETMLPRPSARQFTPYLRQLDELNPAQQAAAANLGVFPGVAVASASASDAPARRDSRSARSNVGAQLEPRGEPLGRGEPETTAGEEMRVDLEQAFAAYNNPTTVSANNGGIDIRQVTPRRDPPPSPAHPSRIWVQVATGTNEDALKFDWRRIARKANGTLDGRGPYISDWGRTNRLLAGPFESSDSASRVMAALKEAGVDTFRHISDEGQVVRSLD